MSVITSFSILTFSELKSSNSPMIILVLLLMIMWSCSINMLLMGFSVWGLIYLIMLFMGGLMISYLFIISMIPKEKKGFSKFSLTKVLFMLMVIPAFWVNPEVYLEESFNLSFWTLIFTILLILIFMVSIFGLMIDPFKTMKSSF